jgi:hypothetical protein
VIRRYFLIPDEPDIFDTFELSFMFMAELLGRVISWWTCRHHT